MRLCLAEIFFAKKEPILSRKTLPWKGSSSLAGKPFHEYDRETLLYQRNPSLAGKQPHGSVKLPEEGILGREILHWLLTGTLYMATKCLIAREPLHFQRNLSK